MPTFYDLRKTTKASGRSQQGIKSSIRSKYLYKRKAAKNNNISEKTLRNRIKTGNFVKGTMSKKCHLGEDACCEWINANPTKKIRRHHFGLLLSKAILFTNILSIFTIY